MAYWRGMAWVWTCVAGCLIVVQMVVGYSTALALGTWSLLIISVVCRVADEILRRLDEDGE